MREILEHYQEVILFDVYCLLPVIISTFVCYNMKVHFMSLLERVLYPTGSTPLIGPVPYVAKIRKPAAKPNYGTTGTSST